MTERLLLLAGAANFALLGGVHLPHSFAGTRLHGSAFHARER